MFKRTVNFIRTVPRYLQLAGLALVLGLLILGADMVINYQREFRIASFSMSRVEHDWTFYGPGGRYGLCSWGVNYDHTPRTFICLGSIDYGLHFSLYAVIGSAHCFLLSATFTVLWLVRRKRK